MAELTIQIVTEQREGLLIELGEILNKYHYKLIRQRMVRDPQGYCLSLDICGPEGFETALEDAIAGHPRVLSFESNHDPASHDTPASLHNAPSPSVERPAAVTPAPPATAELVEAAANRAEIERVLPHVAKDYPHVMPWLINLSQSVRREEHKQTMFLAGKRTGVWVFKRDYALGSQLALEDATKRIVVPALQALVHVDLRDSRLYLKDNDLCRPAAPTGCPFFRGFIEGLLNNALEDPRFYVRESGCCSTGAPECVLEISG